MRLTAALRALRRGHRPVRLGSIGSTQPLSLSWGGDRGTPVDRWYIDRFLSHSRSDITGRVLEVKDSSYADRFGSEVSERAVLDIDPANPRATHVADLSDAVEIPDGSFDCFILTQTLQLVADVPSALAHARRILSPGGVLLLTVPVTSRVCDPPLTDYWRFTPLGMERALGEVFGAEAVTVHGRGNVLSQIAFLSGLAAEDLSEEELSEDDRRFPLLVTARAIRIAPG